MVRPCDAISCWREAGLLYSLGPYGSGSMPFPDYTPADAATFAATLL
jgi:hypothetical protein